MPLLTLPGLLSNEADFYSSINGAISIPRRQSRQRLADRKILPREVRIFFFKNYKIYYFPNKDSIEIYRVLHAGRNSSDLFEDQ